MPAVSYYADMLKTPRQTWRDHQERKRRLMNPVNAIVDIGIDLKRERYGCTTKPFTIIELEQQKPAVEPPPLPPPPPPSPPPQSTPKPPQKWRDLIGVYDVQYATVIHFDTTFSSLLGLRKRSREIYPRQIAMFIAQRLCNQSYSELGRRFGGKDHTTILHAVHRVEAKCNVVHVAADIDAICFLLRKRGFEVPDLTPNPETTPTPDVGAPAVPPVREAAESEPLAAATYSNPRLHPSCEIPNNPLGGEDSCMGSDGADAVLSQATGGNHVSE